VTIDRMERGILFFRLRLAAQPTDLELHHMPQFSRTVKLIRAGVREAMQAARLSGQRSGRDLRIGPRPAEA